MKIVLVLVGLLLLAGLGAGGYEVRSLHDELSQTQARLRAVEAEASSTSFAVHALTSKVDELESKTDDLNDAVCIVALAVDASC